MRIALCTDGIYPHALGGMQRHSRLLAEHLARIPGIELVVLHPHTVSVFDPALRIREVRVAPIDEGRLYIRELYRYSGRVAEALNGVGADVIFSQGFSVWKGMAHFSDRLVVMPHGLEMFQGLTLKDRIIGFPFRLALRHVVRRSAVTVSLGGRLTSVLQRLAKGARAQVVVVPNAVELPAVPPNYPVGDTPLELLFVGRFAFNKGIDLLIEVARRLVREERPNSVRFTLAGDGPERARLEREGLPPNVVFAGKVDDARLEELHAASHALVLPTRFEGMPTVVLEAMARSRPALVSDVGASAELVDDTNGLLLPAGDVDALHQAVMKLAAMDRTQRTLLGAAGRRKVEERFTWPAVATSFAELAARVARTAQRE